MWNLFTRLFRRKTPPAPVVRQVAPVRAGTVGQWRETLERLYMAHEKLNITQFNLVDDLQHQQDDYPLTVDEVRFLRGMGG